MKTAQQIWKKDKSLFLEEPKVLSLDELSKEHFGRMQITVGDTVFETCFLPKRRKDLLVFLSGPSRENYDIPVFWRRSFSAFYADSSLYIDDPAAIRNKFAPSFFWGALDDLVKLVRRFMEICEIPHATFIGSSNTGYVALYCATQVPDAFCIGLSPAFFVSDYVKQTVNFPYDDSLLPPVLDLLDGSTAKCFFAWNRCSYSDEEQIVSFFNRYHQKPVNGYSHFGDITCYVSQRNILHPHLFQPCESMIRYAYLCLCGKLKADSLLFDAMDKTLYLRFTDKDALEEIRQSEAYRIGCEVLACREKYGFLASLFLPFIR